MYPMLLLEQRYFNFKYLRMAQIGGGVICFYEANVPNKYIFVHFEAISYILVLSYAGATFPYYCRTSLLTGFCFDPGSLHI